MVTVATVESLDLDLWSDSGDSSNVRTVDLYIDSFNTNDLSPSIGSYEYVICRAVLLCGLMDG